MKLLNFLSKTLLNPLRYCFNFLFNNNKKNSFSSKTTITADLTIGENPPIINSNDEELDHKTNDDKESEHDTSLLRSGDSIPSNQITKYATSDDSLTHKYISPVRLSADPQLFEYPQEISSSTSQYQEIKSVVVDNNIFNLVSNILSTPCSDRKFQTSSSESSEETLQISVESNFKNFATMKMEVTSDDATSFFKTNYESELMRSSSLDPGSSIMKMEVTSDDATSFSKTKYASKLMRSKSLDSGSSIRGAATSKYAFTELMRSKSLDSGSSIRRSNIMKYASELMSPKSLDPGSSISGANTPVALKFQIIGFYKIKN